jgi:hypothetical protein
MGVVNIGGALFSFFNFLNNSNDLYKLYTCGTFNGLRSLDKFSEGSFLDYSLLNGTGSISRFTGTHFGSLLGEYILPIGLLKDYFPLIF